MGNRSCFAVVLVLFLCIYTEIGAVRSDLPSYEHSGRSGAKLSAVADSQFSVTCRLCKVLGNALLKVFREDNSTSGQLYDTIATLCTNANVEEEEICWGMVLSEGPFFSYVAKNTPSLNATTICGLVMSDCYNGDPLEWTLDLSFVGEKPLKNTTAPTNATNTSNPFRILHLSDYHWDEKYTVGSNAECKEPTCCRSKTDMGTTKSTRAGPWGDYRKCDVPWETVEELHNHTTERQEFDWIYFTGDIIDHGVWETSRESNSRKIRKTMNALKEAYGDTMVLPILGNHESHPLNVFASDNITDEAVSSKWLYELMNETWSLWLPEDTQETILRGGFYTVLVKPGFRVVAVNNMFCYNENWLLVHDPVDPSGQLMWMASVLLEAERAGEKVHILEHMPPGTSDCLSAWSREFGRIVERFSDTITAHFYGHTHKDDFKIFYGDDGVPNNVAFNGGSLTTYKKVNPNYRMYYVDRDSWTVLDAETWGFNLTEANDQDIGERPKWYKIYSFKESYGLPSMHPIDVEKFVYRMANDTDLQQFYYRNYLLDSDYAKSGCDESCAQDLICRIVTTVSGETKYCKKFT